MTGLLVGLGACGGTHGDSSVLAYFEGSFEPATNQMKIQFTRPSGEVLRQGLEYGTTAGKVFLHTCGTNGDPYTNGVWAPPSVGSGFFFELGAMNLTGAALSTMTVKWDSVTGSPLIGCFTQLNGGNCYGGTSAPCTQTFVNVPPTASPFTPADLTASCTTAGAQCYFDFGGAVPPFNFTGQVL